MTTKPFVLMLVGMMLATGSSCVAGTANAQVYVPGISSLISAPTTYDASQELFPHATLTPVAVRERISLNGIWKFQTDPDESGESNSWYTPSYDDSSWMDIKVPSNWNFLFRNTTVPSSSEDYEKTAWYRTTFTVPEEFKGKFVKLAFGAVCYKTKVWINGVVIGEHEGDFLPFEFDLSGKINYGGQNVMALRVETINTDYSASTVPGPKGTYDYWIYDGVYRDVYLEITEPTNIYDVYSHGEPVSSSEADISVEVTMLNTGNSKSDVHMEISISEENSEPLLAKDQAVSIGSAAYLRQVTDFKLQNPKIWSPDTPNMYDCIVSLKDSGGNVIDSVKIQFGVRKVEVSGTKILVNGQEAEFRGVCRHDEYPLLGRTMPDEIYLHDLDMMKDAHINALRTGHYPNDPRIYNFTDHFGFWAFEEIPCTTLLPNAMLDSHVQALAKDYMARMIYRDRNHPSIIIWSVGNEAFVPNQDFNKMLYDQAKAIDTTRLVTYVHVGFGTIPPADLVSDLVCDVLSANLYWGWYYGSTTDLSWYLDLLHSLNPNKPILMTEYGADAHKDERSNSDPKSSAQYTEDYQCYQLKTSWDIAKSKDYMAGAFIWIFADFLSPAINKGPTWTNYKGLFTGDRAPKNSYLTVMGMYGNLPLHNLTVKVTDGGGSAVNGSIVDVYSHDGSWVGRQLTNANGEFVLWYIPDVGYTIHARQNNNVADGSILLSKDDLLTLKLLPTPQVSPSSENKGFIPGFEVFGLMAGITVACLLVRKRIL